MTECGNPPGIGIVIPPVFDQPARNLPAFDPGTLIRAGITRDGQTTQGRQVTYLTLSHFMDFMRAVQQAMGIDRFMKMDNAMTARDTGGSTIGTGGNQHEICRRSGRNKPFQQTGQDPCPVPVKTGTGTNQDRTRT
ncbi:hypothetical protein AA16373_1279 [Komagataeibacter swingsii DSM 16373]|nr:hypothetical protein AA16373_1279 [Komagataeibacter swingsii DSM 16373]